ncbi:MAG: hypothetical protein ACRCUE_19795 [Bosea sp. (in: a-proteobacteria)]
MVLVVLMCPTVIPGHRTAMSPEPINVGLGDGPGADIARDNGADGFRARLCRPGMTAIAGFESGGNQP